VLALAADLLGVHARGLVAVMAVGDEQLGGGERLLEGLDRGGIGHAPEPVDRAVVVGQLADGIGGRQHGCGGADRVVVEAEDGGEVRSGRACEAQAVLLGARVGALVRADAPGAVVLDAHTREDAVAGQRATIGAGVVLREGPQRGLVVAHDGALGLPALEDRRRLGIGVPPARPTLGQVDAHDVVGRAIGELPALLGVDDVVGRRRDVAKRADLCQVVVQGAQGLDVGHGGPRP
jgi:hypothetical protein